MKKVFIAVLALVLVAYSQNTFAQAGDQEKGASFILNEDGDLEETTAPVFEFEQESHDFGEIPEGPKVSYEFKFTNVGKEPLIIKHVKASCGCTTPEWPKEPIMPGEESTIKAVYNTSKRPGPFNKSITITSNAYTPTKRLFIKGKVDRAETENPALPVKKKSIVSE